MADSAKTVEVPRLPYEQRPLGDEGQVERALFDLLESDSEFEGDQPDGDGPTDSQDDDGEQDEADDDSDSQPDEDAEVADEDGESDEDEESAEEDEEPAVYTVKVDGEEVEVTQEELLKGYSRQADYTRKAQDLAEERRTLDSELQGARAARDQYAQQLEVLAEALATVTPAQPDWDALRRENPAEYAARFADHQRRQSQAQAVEAERQRVAADRFADEQRQQAARLEVEKAALLEAMPTWKDADKARSEKAALVSYAKQLGFTEDDLKQVYDHRVLVMLNKARRYDALMAKDGKGKGKIRATKVVKPGGQAPTTSKPTGSKTAKKAYQARRQQLARSGRISDAAAVLETLVDLD